MSAASLARRAYERIQHNILCGELPSGSVISEAALAKELGFSRTPVAAAIRQLENEGLVRRVPRYGTIIKAPSPTDLAEQYEMRELIESYAAGKAAAQIKPEVLTRLREQCETMERITQGLRASGLSQLPPDLLRQFLAADLAFHVLILEAAGNRRMLKIVQDMRAISRIIGLSRVAHDREVLDNACESHRAILDALAARDAERTKRLMGEHIRWSRQRTLARLEQDAILRAPLPRASVELIDDLDHIEQAGHIDDPASTEPDAGAGNGATRRRE